MNIFGISQDITETIKALWILENNIGDQNLCECTTRMSDIPCSIEYLPRTNYFRYPDK